MNDADFEFKEPKIAGLGGWLILVAIGLILSPLLILNTLLTVHLPLLNDGTFNELTSSSSEYFIPGFSLVMSFEVLGNLTLFFFIFYLLYLFFSKSKSFPLFFIYYRVGYLVFILLDIIFVKMVLPGLPMFDAASVRELFSAIFSVVIWVPYILRSKRVKNTFIY
mgnify:CR=1 FL=1